MTRPCRHLSPSGRNPDSIGPAILVESVGKAYAPNVGSVSLLSLLQGKSNNSFQDAPWALRDVSFKVMPGEVVGIVGENGAGKSTLLQIITNVLTPTTGRVQLNGQVASLLELGAGFNPEFTGRENVILTGILLGLDSDAIRERMGDILAFARIGKFIDKPVKTYSSGMYARLAFSVAIHTDANVLIVDEILSVGDESFQRKCFAKISELRDRGCSILFVSHSSQTVASMCDRAILLDRGRLLMDDSPRRVINSYHKIIYSPESLRASIVEEIAILGSQPELAKIEKPAASNVSGCEVSKLRLPKEAAQGDIVDDNKLCGSRSASGDTQSALAPEGLAGIPENPHSPAWQSEDHTPSPEEVMPVYDESLVPETTVEYAVNGSRISNLRVLDVQGNRVNLLHHGGIYRIVYDVQFLEESAYVHCGSHFLTMSGVAVTYQSAPSDGTFYVEVKPGEHWTIEFTYHMLLAPGTYFIGCGVFAHRGEKILHRLVESQMVKVVAMKKAIPFGIVDLALVKPRRMVLLPNEERFA